MVKYFCYNQLTEQWKYRITDILKTEIDIITSIPVSSIGRAVILVIMCVETFKTKDIIVYL